jgi:hypothetical protein
MKKRVIGIILVIAALGTMLLGIKAGGAAPENKKIIEEAVEIRDGKVLPENEGKVVIVAHFLKAPLPFVDEQTGIPLNSVVALRRVEKLVIEEGKKEGDKKDPDTWKWEFSALEKHYGGSRKLIAPNLTLGEFQISDTLLQAVNAYDKLSDYSYVDLSALGFDDFKEDNTIYLYTGERMPRNEEEVRKTNLLGLPDYDYMELIDTLRVSYKVIADDSLDYTIIGLQKDGMLEDMEALKMTDVFSGHLTMEELLEYADSSAASAKVAAFIIAAVLAGIGGIMIVKNSKSKKPI